MSYVVCTLQLNNPYSPQHAWAVVSDTNRLNREAGLAPVKVSPNADTTAARWAVSTKLGGFWIKYNEEPYEWAEGQRLCVSRMMTSGPLHLLQMQFHVAPQGSGSRIQLRACLVPRHRWFAPVAKIAGLFVVWRLRHRLRTLLRDGPGATLGTASLTRLDKRYRRLLRLTGGATEATQVLRNTLLQAPEPLCGRLRPYALAAQHGLDRAEMLRVFLLAARAGLLKARWEVVCQSCRSGIAPAAKGAHAHCHLCDLRADGGIELVFAPPPDVRRLPGGLYCPGGPAHSPHVQAQTMVPPYGLALLRVPQAVGTHQLFVRGGQKAPLDVVDGAPAQGSCELGHGQLTPPMLGPGARLILRNSGPVSLHAKLEWAPEPELAVRLGDVQTSYEYAQLGKRVQM